ncbi:MAG: hypothetical protein CME71_00345 [Halobacteriovorax sp.]|nr:hypothetical protein [Halobacteriovorax sp.]|tara:strand:+ start:138 stop:614 length:477 start_codon:yes stop_codon:yes gene_type:complete
MNLNQKTTQADKDDRSFTINQILPQKAIRVIREFENDINIKEEYFIYHITGNAEKNNGKFFETTFVTDSIKKEIVRLYKQFAIKLDSDFCYTVMITEISLQNQPSKEQVVTLIESRGEHFIDIQDVSECYRIPDFFLKMDSIRGNFSNILCKNNTIHP